ncbi:YbaN family protein [Pokkaliibacter sp. CJK22405]|uniref:YbaN family protein n=1 Tax=Pokkaliibacter sp. CJK22405 TaxID=3384615 RepID=UPI0039852FF5
MDSIPEDAAMTLSPAPVSRLARCVWLVLGWLALAMGILGIILPGLPGTVFILASAACFAKGSPRVYQALLNHRLTGPSIYAWQQYRAMPRRAKLAAYTTLFIAWAVGMVVFAPWAGKIAYTLLMMVISAGIACMPVLEDCQAREARQY